MSDIKEVKANGQKLIMIGLTVSDTIVSTFRALIDSWKANGEKSMEEYIKSLKGKRFKDEGVFILNAKKENTGLSETAVSNTELKEFEKLCKQYGIDYHFQRRPENLDDLFERKQRGETLSKHQENVVNAFTEYNDRNEPMLKQDSALITFKEKDLKIMERVVDKMEEKTYGLEQRKLRAMKISEKHKKQKQKTKEKKVDIDR